MEYVRAAITKGSTVSKNKNNVVLKIIYSTLVLSGLAEKAVSS